MVIQVFGKNKCFKTQKVLRFFKERRIDIHFIDLSRYTFSKKEFLAITNRIPVESMLDKNSKRYKDLYFEHMERSLEDLMEVIIDNPTVVLTPIVRSDRGVVVGDNVEELKKII